MQQVDPKGTGAPADRSVGLLGMNVYEVRHDGIWLGGLSIVVAPDEARALALTKFAMVEHKLKTDGIRVVRKLNLEQEHCFVLENGDY